MGLYFKISIVFFYIPIFAIYLIIKNIISSNHKKDKIKVFNIKRYFKYLNIVINKQVISCIVIFSIISNSIVIIQNYKYDNMYKGKTNLNGQAIICSNCKEKEYYYVYKIKIVSVDNMKNKNQLKNTYLYLNVNKKDFKDLYYGDKIYFSGEFIEPTEEKNFGGFNYKQYLKTLKIYGTVKSKRIEVLSSKNVNTIFYCINKVSIKLKNIINSLFQEEQASLLNGILLGDNSKIGEETKENFRIGNISHVLAVSGMHVTYLIIGINLIFTSIIGKRKSKVVIIIFLIFYSFLTGFSPSILRASITGILVMIAGLIYQKNDMWNSLSISLFFILIYNPFLIVNIGLQLSYLGTIGILVFSKTISKILDNIRIKNPKYKYKINKKIVTAIEKIKEILAVTISAQLMILPIIIYNFNFFGTYFILTNILVSFITGPIIILRNDSYFLIFYFSIFIKNNSSYS